MRTQIQRLVVAAALGITVQQASAVVTFAFADEEVPDGRFVYTGPGAARASGLLAYNDAAPVDLKVAAPGEAGGQAYTYVDAKFTFTADVGAFGALGPPGKYFAPLSNGSFTFSTSGGDLLMTGSFGSGDDAYLYINLSSTGSVEVSTEYGGLDLTPTALLLADLTDNAKGGIDTPILDFAPPSDSNWTLTDISLLATKYVNNGLTRGIYLQDFNANSAYSGTTNLLLVPTPASAALASLGLACVGIRRRR